MRKARPVKPPARAAVDLKQENAALKYELAQSLERLAATHRDLEESLERQTATSDILRAIAASPGEAKPTLRKIAETTAQLFDAAGVSIRVVEGEEFKLSVGIGRGAEQVTATLWEDPARRPTLRGANFPAAVVRENRQIQIRDLDNPDPAMADWPGPPVARAAGIRTMVGTPLRSGGGAIGAMMVYRDELRPFDEGELQLLQSFADQAAIAIENARLMADTREALDQQTATAEVLRIINGSPGELAPVFRAILEKAHSLCAVAHGSLQLYRDGKFHAVAAHGLPEALERSLRQGYSPGPSHPTRQLLEGERFAQTVDWGKIDDPIARVVELSGIRTTLYIPLRKDDALLGYFSAARQEARPFTEKEIALLEGFAAQAVIAMENARLITETREALERQTATAEVLQVINSSPGDLAPVFDTILDKAHGLCSIAYGSLQLYDGGVFRAVAVHGLSQAFADLLRQGYSPGPNHPSHQLLRGAPFAHIADVKEIDDPTARAAVELAGVRTTLFVPLRKEKALLGQIVAQRLQINPFTDREIALLQNFAAQAVIAMENARLITETREALEQQTATAEVLQVINSSPGDLAPVFDAMLDKAMRVCDAAFGQVFAYDGEQFDLLAVSAPPEFAEAVRRYPPFQAPPNSALDRLARGENLVHIQDLAADPAFAPGSHDRARILVEIGKCRTLLSVGLRKDDALLGAISVYRQQLRAFSEKQIALLQNFAAQAVIAMENARLITETREALDQQTATSEVLQVINSSPGELAPVFDAMLDKALRLCDAAFGKLIIHEGEGHFHSVAERSIPEPYSKFLAGKRLIYGLGTGPDRLLKGAELVHTPDLRDEEPYRAGEPNRRALVELGGARTSLQVPLRKDSALLGIIDIYRQDVRPFSDKQIALVRNFASQAVIAMENARLLGELRQRTTELARSVDELTATGDVLKIISSSSVDLETVLDTLVETVARLCRADNSYMFRRRDDKYHLVTALGLSAEEKQFIATHPFAADRGSLSGRVELERRPVHVPDVLQDPEYTYPGQQVIGYRTMLGVPLVRGDTLIGVLVANRTRVEPFTHREIELVTTFADQAVIAIENARLFDELRERQAELRVTFDNMGDGVAMFDAEPRLVAWNRNFQQILDLPDALLAQRPTYNDYLRVLAERGEFGTEDIEAGLSRRLEDTGRELRLERTRPDGRVIEVRRNAVPGGGFVLIYADITERKRAEAAISAARDAAETALRDLQAAQASLLHAQKMAALGQLTAGIAHEIKNPLNFVNNFAGLSVELLDELKEATTQAIGTLGADKRAEVIETIGMLTGNLEKIAEHGRRADGIVKSMLQHSRGGSGDRQTTDLNALLEEALNLAYHGARAQDQSFNITLERDLDQDLAPIEVVPQDVMRVFLNLIGNGFYAANRRTRDGEDTFRPVLTVATRDFADAVEVRVRDNGIGISAEHREKLFQPFFTTKPTGEGTGLGLSISYEIVTQQHSGTITVDSEVGQFTEFTVRLPRHRQATTRSGL